MTQEEKQLLLKDLCARLPYDVIVNDGNEIDTLKAYMLDDLMFIDEAIIRPYLRPMSNMTEEEINEFILISETVLWLGNKRSTCILSLEQINWLNAHHFDYRGLIEKGLALEAPEDMYKNE